MKVEGEEGSHAGSGEVGVGGEGREGRWTGKEEVGEGVVGDHTCERGGKRMEGRAGLRWSSFENGDVKYSSFFAVSVKKWWE